MMLLSVVSILVTGGISLLLSWMHVFRIARKDLTITSKVNTLLVLGKRLMNEQPDPEFIERLKRAAQILAENESDNIYILGGKTRNADISEALAGKTYLINAGVDPKLIFLEEESRNTVENLKHFSNISIIKHHPVLLITNRYHLARSLIMSKGFGINVNGCPAESKLSYSPRYIIKTLIEAFYLHWYLTGKFWASLTNNKRMQNRIS